MEGKEYGADFKELKRRCEKTAREIAGGLKRAEEEQSKSPCDSETGHAMLRLSQAICGIEEEAAGVDDVRKAFEDYCRVYAENAGGLSKGGYEPGRNPDEVF